jgi:hypothetical protein
MLPPRAPPLQADASGGFVECECLLAKTSRRNWRRHQGGKLFDQLERRQFDTGSTVGPRYPPTLVGIELMHMLKKKQMALGAEEEGLSAAEQFYALAA